MSSVTKILAQPLVAAEWIASASVAFLVFRRAGQFVTVEADE
jgi:hypothetical protein